MLISLILCFLNQTYQQGLLLSVFLNLSQYLLVAVLIQKENHNYDF